MKKALLSWLGLLAGAALWAADPDYQRYDLVREPSELLVEGSFHYWAEETDARDFHTLLLGVSAEYSFKTSHSVSFSLPYTLGLYNNPDSRQKEYYSFGDLRLSYEYLKRFNHINLFFGPLVTIHCQQFKRIRRGRCGGGTPAWGVAEARRAGARGASPLLEPVQNLEFWRCKRQNSTLQARKEPENRDFCGQ
ncbi:MAG: hypothetical protein LBD18_01540 [Treponema sp.]|nr:hypothetical protein [Treponema sp.]